MARMRDNRIAHKILSQVMKELDKAQAPDL